MNCMKCGRETVSNDVFCSKCLAEMAKYPVHPGAVVFLPRRRETSVVRKPLKRHVPTVEKQMKVLRKWMRILLISLIVCVVLILLMFKPTMHYVLDEHVPIGQNYSSVTATTPPAASPAAK